MYKEYKMYIWFSFVCFFNSIYFKTLTETSAMCKNILMHLTKWQPKNWISKKINKYSFCLSENSINLGKIIKKKQFSVTF